MKVLSIAVLVACLLAVSTYESKRFLKETNEFKPGESSEKSLKKIIIDEQVKNEERKENLVKLSVKNKVINEMTEQGYASKTEISMSKNYDWNYKTIVILRRMVARHLKDLGEGTDEFLKAIDNIKEAEDGVWTNNKIMTSDNSKPDTVNFMTLMMVNHVEDEKVDSFMMSGTVDVKLGGSIQVIETKVALTDDEGHSLFETTSEKEIRIPHQAKNIKEEIKAVKDFVDIIITDTMAKYFNLPTDAAQE